MTAVVRLWWLLRRRSAGRSDPQALATVLAVVAFAVTTALVLVVLGGVHAFDQRHLTEISGDYGDSYPLLARLAAGLLLLPLATLGGAAARLVAARRDARLAALRLSGATTAQAGALTVLESGSQALLGGVLGVAGYGLLLPVVSLLRFQGRRFDLAELWVGVPLVLVAVAAVTLVALLSAVSSLRRVAITPLGVAARTRPAGLRTVRLLTVVVASAAFSAAIRLGHVGPVVIIALLVAGAATINVIGPLLASVQGRIVTARAKDVPTLLAGRRLVDSPRTAWRSVGGVALATFIAGVTSLAAILPPGADAPGDERTFLADVQTGGMLTLAIAGLLAAVSTGVLQSGRVIDQRSEYRALALAGTDLAVLDKARMKESLLPLYAAVGTSVAVVLVMLVPALGFTAFANVQVLAQFFAGVVGACALVAAGAYSSRTTMRAVLRDDPPGRREPRRNDPAGFSEAGGDGGI